MDIKNKIAERLSGILSEKILALEEAVLSARESRDSDTKSSAGDKHETSRELAQAEIDKLENQLMKTRMLESELRNIDLGKTNDVVTQGSLVFTNHETYFISIAMGKIAVDDESFYVISLNSPLGSVLKLKKKEDSIHFQGREIIIKKIL